MARPGGAPGAGERLRSNVAASFIPLSLVAAYTIVVLTASAVAFADFMGLFEQYLRKFMLILLALLIASAPLLLVTNLLRGETKDAPLIALTTVIGKGWQRDRLLSVLTPPFYLALLLASFSTFKQTVLPSAGFDFDASLAAVDRMIFFGVDPWRITHSIVPSHVGTRVFDIAYLIWFLPLCLSVLLSWKMPLPLRAQFLTAFALTWILLGSVLAYGMPAAGPCYYEHFYSGEEMFSGLTEKLAAQNEMLISDGGSGLVALLGQQQLLLAYETRDLQLAAGISAMPSLHIALAVLFACAAFKLGKLAGWLFAAFALVIWFGSVHLGWHYAIDGAIGGAGAVAVWQLAGFLTRRFTGLEASDLQLHFPHAEPALLRHEP